MNSFLSLANNNDFLSLFVDSQQIWVVGKLLRAFKTRKQHKTKSKGSKWEGRKINDCGDFSNISETATSALQLTME